MKRQLATVRPLREWSKETSVALQDCLETTDWGALYEPHGKDIDRLADCVTDYIIVCVDNTVPAKSIRCFSNREKEEFKSGDMEAVKEVQWCLSVKIKEGKGIY